VVLSLEYGGNTAHGMAGVHASDAARPGSLGLPHPSSTMTAARVHWKTGRRSTDVNTMRSLYGRYVLRRGLWAPGGPCRILVSIGFSRLFIGQRSLTTCSEPTHSEQWTTSLHSQHCTRTCEVDDGQWSTASVGSHAVLMESRAVDREDRRPARPCIRPDHSADSEST